MRKVAEISICGVCLTVVAGDPRMCDGDMQAACAEAAPLIAENWPGYNLHATEGEPGTSSAGCDGCGNPLQGELHPAVVLAPEYELTNVTNLAAFGVEWTHEGDSRYQLVNSRGTTTLMFSIKLKGSDQWHTNMVADPSQFGLTSAPGTFKAFKAIAHAFANGDQS